MKKNTGIIVIFWAILAVICTASCCVSKKTQHIISDGIIYSQKRTSSEKCLSVRTLKDIYKAKPYSHLRIHKDIIFVDTLVVPKDCELYFDGGSLAGPIKFQRTYLSGKVALLESTLSGDITNSTFHTSWLCHRDGIKDDAAIINNIIEICDSVCFDKGTYRLISLHNIPFSDFTKSNRQSVLSHIGINRDNVCLYSDSGAVLISSLPETMISIYSRPYSIDNSVQNISIRGLNFCIENDGKNFYEFKHTIKVVGVNGAYIQGCVFNDFWGDAICLSHYGDTRETGERSRNSNVAIVNNSIIGGKHHSNRNGISVINGKSVLIEGNIIQETSRKDMPGAIDIEPNNETNTIVDIKIVNNTIDRCQGTAGGICIHSNGKGSKLSNITIENNTVTKSTAGIAIVESGTNSSSGYTIKNNTLEGNKNDFFFYGKGESKNWVVTGNKYKKTNSPKFGGNIKINNLIQ